MFGIIPKPLWERRIAPDASNRIPLAMRCLLLRGHDRVILVDTGLGHKTDARFDEIYAVDRSTTLEGSLDALGVAPEDVTDVLLTHLHFDHAGGVSRRGTDGALVLTFSHATHHVQRRHWEWAHESPREGASFLPENLDPMEDAGRLNLLDPGDAPFPHVELVTADGHTRGQQLPLIRGDDATLFYAGDLLPTTAHVPLLWGMAYDVEPLATLAEKEATLARAVAERWWVVFEHDRDTALARIEHGEKGWRAADRRPDLPERLGN